MLFLFGDALPIPVIDANLVTLGTVAAGLLGTVAWILKSALPAMLKQHRDDIFALHETCRSEREANEKQHSETLERRDSEFCDRLDKIAEQLNRGVCRHEPPSDSGALRTKKGQS